MTRLREMTCWQDDDDWAAQEQAQDRFERKVEALAVTLVLAGLCLAGGAVGRWAGWW